MTLIGAIILGVVQGFTELSAEDLPLLGAGLLAATVTALFSPKLLFVMVNKIGLASLAMVLLLCRIHHPDHPANRMKSRNRFEIRHER